MPGKYDSKTALIPFETVDVIVPKDSTKSRHVRVEVDDVLIRAGMLTPTEPFFYIRGQDHTAPAAIESYANGLNLASSVARFEADQVGPTDSSFDRFDKLAADLHDQALKVFEFAEHVRIWQRENPEQVKLPD